MKKKYIAEQSFLEIDTPKKKRGYRVGRMRMVVFIRGDVVMEVERQAADRGVVQSEIVEECLLSALVNGAP